MSTWEERMAERAKARRHEPEVEHDVPTWMGLSETPPDHLADVCQLCWKWLPKRCCDAHQGFAWQIQCKLFTPWNCDCGCHENEVWMAG